MLWTLLAALACGRANSEGVGLPLCPVQVGDVVDRPDVRGGRECGRCVSEGFAVAQLLVSSSYQASSWVGSSANQAHVPEARSFNRRRAAGALRD